MKKDFDEEKAKQQLKKATNKAQHLIDNPDEAKKILNDAIKKADNVKGPFEKIWQELQLMFGVIRSWLKGEYREIPVGSIIAILGALVYFLSPIDIIPDVIPGVGYIDDVFVIGLVINQVRADLYKYKNWKENIIEI